MIYSGLIGWFVFLFKLESFKISLRRKQVSMRGKIYVNVLPPPVSATIKLWESLLRTEFSAIFWIYVGLFL